MMYKRRRISYLLASIAIKFCISTHWHEKKSLPVEGCSSHFSCVVADMFNIFVSQLSNEAAIVSKVLSKSNCGNERRETTLNSLSDGCSVRCPGMRGEKAGVKVNLTAEKS